ncbi:MAG TPA: hypothetical protein VFT39_21115 [Vicinamibacterales bacterium]|nr:hypothetical protein [Vicinamibacterales bacterium]
MTCLRQGCGGPPKRFARRRKAKNLFNTENIAGVNRVVTTDAQGNPVNALVFHGDEYPTAGKSGYDQRVMQLGVKFLF